MSPRRKNVDVVVQIATVRDDLCFAMRKLLESELKVLREVGKQKRACTSQSKKLNASRVSSRVFHQIEVTRTVCDALLGGVPVHKIYVSREI